MPIGDAKILRWCLPGMRVWQLAVCKLCSRLQKFCVDVFLACGFGALLCKNVVRGSRSHTTHLTPRILIHSSHIAHLSPPFHTTHLIHLSHNISHTQTSHTTHLTHLIQHVTYTLISHHSSLTTHLPPLISHHSALTTLISRHHTPLISFISRHSFHTTHLAH